MKLALIALVIASLGFTLCQSSAFADSYPNEIKSATSGSHVYVVWQQRSDSPFPEQNIYFRASSDNGATFAYTIRLNENQNNDPWGPGIKEDSPSIAASENHVYITWVEYEKGIPSGWNLAVSDDYGAHFRRPVIFQNTSIEYTYLLASENMVYLFWVNGTLSSNPNFQLFVEKSDDYGKTFDAPVEMFSDTFITLPQITVSKGNIFSAWSSGFPIHINGNTYYNSTTVFAKFNTQNSTGTTSSLYNYTEDHFDKIITSGNSIYILFNRHVPSHGIDTVYLTTSKDGGRLFETPIELTGKYNGSSQIDPADMVVSGTDIHVMWYEIDWKEKNVTPKLYVISSYDIAKSFGNKTLVSENAISNGIIANGNTMYLIYESPPRTIHNQIFLATSPDGGKSFTTRPLSNNTGMVDQSYAIMTGDGKVNVYWHDTTGNSDKLFYLGDINSTKVTNLLDKIPKQHQSIWTNDETIIKQPDSKKQVKILVPENKTNQPTPVVNTTVSYGPKSVIKIDSPLKQFKSGVVTQSITCKEGFILAIKKQGHQPACVNPDTVPKLVLRGWSENPLDSLLLKYGNQTQANLVFYDILNEPKIRDWSMNGWRYSDYSYASNGETHQSSATVHLYLPSNVGKHECENGSYGFVVINLKPVEIEHNYTKAGCNVATTTATPMDPESN